VLQIHSVNPTGVGPYGFHETISLDDGGLIWLEGQNQDKGGSNGSGKTWLLNTISICLFGKVETQVGTEVLKDDAINNVWGSGCCARVVFTNKNQQIWRVTFSRKWKQDPPYENDSQCYPFHGSDIYLECFNGEEWLDKREAEMPKTAAKLRNIVGCSYEQYLTTTYLAQGKGKQFIQGSHAQRMAIMTDVTGIDIWDKAEAQYKLEAASLEKQIRDLELQIASVNGKISSTSILEEGVLASLKSGQTQLKANLDELLLNQTSLEAERVTNQKWLYENQLAQNPYPQQIQNLRQSGNAIANARSVIEARIRNHPLIEQITHSAVLGWLAAKSAYDSALNQPDNCPACKQPVPKIVNLEELEFSFLKAERLATAFRIRDGVCDGLELAEANEKCIHDQKEVARLIAEAEANSVKHDQDQESLIKKRAEIDARTLAINTIVSEISNKRVTLSNQLNEIGFKISQNDVQVKQLAEWNNQSLTLVNQLNDLRMHRAEWDWLSKACRLIKSYKLVGAVERLNELLAESLKDLDGSFSVYCKPWRPKPQALKKPELDWQPDDVIQDFTVFVSEGDKKEVPLGLYSGGEVSIIALAFLVAFWRLSSELGSGSNLLALDETFGALDSRNSQIVANFLETLRGTGKTVLVISHAQVIDQVNWDQRWVVKKQNGMSNLEKVV